MIGSAALYLFAVANALCSGALLFAGLLATTSGGAIVALSISGLNAAAGILTGYAALRTLRKGNREKAHRPSRRGRGSA